MLIIIVALISTFSFTISKGNINDPPRGDAATYNDYAIAILETPDYLTNYESKRPPVYPTVIAIVYQIVGINNYFAMKILNGIFIAFACVITYLIGREVFNSAIISLFSALWCATYSHFLFISSTLLRESLLILLIVSISYITIKYIKSSQNKYLYYLILLMGILVHTDPKFLALIPVPIIAMMFTSPDGSLKKYKITKDLFIYFGLIVLLLVPWTVRNYWVYDRFVLLTPHLGSKLALDPPRLVEKYYEDVDRADLFNKQYSIKEKIGFKLNAVPFQFLDFWRFARFSGEYRPFPDVRYEKQWSDAHNISLTIQFGLLLPMFLYGLKQLLEKKNNYLLMLILPILTLNIIHVIQHAKPRYRIPIEPLIFLIAFFGISELWNRYKPNKYRK